MSRNENTQKLIEEIKLFLDRVNENNFSKSYDGLVEIINNYKGALSIEEVKACMFQVDDEMEMNESQEEVFLEVSAMVEGFKSDSQNIGW